KEKQQEEINAAYQAKLEDERRIIRETFTTEGAEPLNPRSLSLESAVYLLTFIRLGASEDFTHIEPAQFFAERLAPTSSFTTEIIRLLSYENLITPHPDSSPQAFEFEGDEITSYYINRVMWNISIGNNIEQKKNIINELELMFKDKDWPRSWAAESRPLWKKIALEECLEYLEISLGEHNFSINPGEKTRLVFDNLLEDYSVAQAYNLIWQGVKDAASFYVRQQVTRSHAANYAINAIQRKAERGLAEGWEYKAFRRNFKCPQSAVSALFFNTVLQIGEIGFSVPPRLNE
ncbi:MAG: hypothetical protein QOE47_2051, partial [Pyrinomonadaceae bacterium]|nr:hypothetical protein [Pyrinomonadaceae bacterium]